MDEVAEMVAIAREICDGTLDVLLGCGYLSSVMLCADLETEPEWQIIALASGDACHLPLGTDRQYWNAAALKRKDEEIASITAKHREQVLCACRRLIERFGKMT